jgi:hypothetical protein
LPDDYADWGTMKQSMSGIARRFARACLGGALVGSLAGCGLSSITSGLGSSVFGGSPSGNPQVQSVSEEQLLNAAKADGSSTGSTSVGEIAAGCPRFNVWPRDNNITIYEQGRVGEGLAIMHRGEITKTARECHVEGSRVTVKYGFSGRVLLGPRGKSGTVSFPLNVFVTDAKREKISGDKLKVDVTVALEKPIGYFSAVRTISFNVPEGSRPGEYELFVGFDRNIPGAG